MVSQTGQVAAPSAEAIAATRARIVRIGKLLFKRHLTDAGGGNISVRVGDVLCLTPRYSGSQRQWQLEPEDVLVVDMDRNILDGKGQLSRETNVHFRLHSEFGEFGTAVIHAHARNLLVFASLNQPLPPILEGTRKFGVTPVIDYAPAHSIKLAENVANSIRGREARIKNHAAAVIAPWHGVFLMGRDLDAAFDAVERLDTNAYCLLMGRMYMSSEAVAENMKVMETTMANFKE
jgi:L-fuculose-phosphate aldolase